MNTAFVLAAALTSFFGSNVPTTPTWTGSYVQAQSEAAGKKPLAVVFGSGQDGWAKLVRSEESKKLLAEQYVCVYVDVTSDSGKALARSFAINNTAGVVLSDRSGAFQAFWHDGELADPSLVRSLRKYGNSTAVVTTTEQEGVVTRISNYPSNDAIFGAGQPARPSCPNGNCPYAR